MDEEFAERFWARTVKDPATGCLRWLGGHDGKGRAAVSLNGRSVIAARVAVQLVGRQIPEGMHCLHACDNGGCIEPEHIYFGTHKQNMRDMVERGRAHDANATACRRGHPKEPGQKRCRQCKAIHQRTWEEKQRRPVP